MSIRLNSLHGLLIVGGLGALAIVSDLVMLVIARREFVTGGLNPQPGSAHVYDSGSTRQ